MHTDRGSVYTGRAFRDLCLDQRILPSVGKTGICFDNAAAESFNALYKKELIHLSVWADCRRSAPPASSTSRPTTTAHGSSASSDT